MFKWVLGIGLVLLVLIGGCTAGCKAALSTSEKTQVLHIDGKESVAKDKGHEYRVYTNKGVYVVTDSLMYWNFRAADRYHDLEVGKNYRCFQAGWRIGFFSEFPNLLRCEKA